MAVSIAHIFGSEAKVKIMRMFIFNPRSSFGPKEISLRAKERPAQVRKALRELSMSGLIKKRSRGYILDDTYPYLKALSNFLIDATPITEKEIVRRVQRTGVLKLVLIAGVFTHDPESRVDILVVGDNLKKKNLMNAIASIEADLGKEIRYAAFETVDFRYRMGVYDKLIRDILDFPHVKILNKMGL